MRSNSTEKDKRTDRKIVIHAETYFAPIEFTDYYNSIKKCRPLLAKKYDDSFTMSDFSNFKVLQNYKRTELAEDVNFYSNGQSHEAKTLLVCFCGVGKRVGITAPSFLQRIDAERFDVVMLSDAACNHFRQGITGFGSSFQEVVENIEKYCFTHEYESVFSLGNSMGALVALRYSQYARCDRSIAIAPRIVDDTYRVFLDKQEVQAFDPLCHCRFDQVQNPVVVYSECNEKDEMYSKQLASIMDAKLFSLNNAVKHRTLLEAHRLNRAKGLLDMLLAPALPTDASLDFNEDRIREPRLYVSKGFFDWVGNILPF